MGCDIHLHIEIKIDGVWHHYAHPSVRRDYQLFAKMGGVRNYDNEIEPIGELRGLPTDVSLITKRDYERWSVNGHSHGWLSSAELVVLEDWNHARDSRMENDLEYSILSCYLFGNSFAGFHKYPKERITWLEDVRFVFWFDN